MSTGRLNHLGHTCSRGPGGAASLCLQSAAASPTPRPHRHHCHTRLRGSEWTFRVHCSNAGLTDGGLRPGEGDMHPKATHQGQEDLGSAFRFLPPGTRCPHHPGWLCHQENPAFHKATHSPVSHEFPAGLPASETWEKERRSLQSPPGPRVQRTASRPLSSLQSPPQPAEGALPPRLTQTHHLTWCPCRCQLCGPSPGPQGSPCSLPPPTRAQRPLTGHGGSVAIWIPHDELVLQAAPPHTLRSDEHQGFPAEGGHAGHLLINEQLVAVKL